MVGRVLGTQYDSSTWNRPRPTPTVHHFQMYDRHSPDFNRVPGESPSAAHTLVYILLETDQLFNRYPSDRQAPKSWVIFRFDSEYYVRRADQVLTAVP